MPETLLLTFIYCKYKKYSLKPLFQVKEMYYILALEIMYIYLQSTLFRGNYRVIQYADILKNIYLCSYLGLIWKYQLYKEAMIGSGCMILGGMCNRLAMSVNGGKMPVFPTLSYITGYAEPEAFKVAYQVAQDFHVLGDESTKLKILTDIVDVGYSILSIGDLLIRVFVIVVIYGAVKRIHTVNQNTQFV